MNAGLPKKKKKKKDALNLAVIARYFCSIGIFITGMLLVKEDATLPAFIVFLCLMILQVVQLYAESHRFSDLRILVTVSWIGGITLSILRLSEWQTEWSNTMWACCAFFYFLFQAGYDLRMYFYRIRHDENVVTLDTGKAAYEKRLFQAVLILTAVCLLAFLLEGVLLEFRYPLLVKNTPHAYTDFKVTGVHYFTVSSVLVHPLSVIYLFRTEEPKKKKIFVIFLNVLALAVPVLLLSKYLVFIAILYTILAFFCVKKLPAKTVVLITAGALIAAAAAFALVVSMRHYPEGHLQSVFRFRNQETPVAIQYPYIYITINFENLNRQIARLQHFSYGLRSALPFFALTGMKKFVPAVTEAFNALERYAAFWQLPTETLLYDVYSDFYLYGVAVFSVLLGLASAWVTHIMEKRQKVLGIMLYVQFAGYLLLSFFSTWFSNATTWFYFVATFAIAFFCTGEEKGFFRFHIRELTGEMKS